MPYNCFFLSTSAVFWENSDSENAPWLYVEASRANSKFNPPQPDGVYPDTIIWAPNTHVIPAIIRNIQLWDEIIAETNR